MKKILFFTTQLIFIITINSFVYIDLMAELILQTVSATPYFNKVTLSDLYINTIGIFMVSSLPLLLLSYLVGKMAYSRLWIFPVFIIYTISWVHASHVTVAGYVQFFGHTWLYMEVFYFTLGQQHFYIAYAISLWMFITLIYFSLKHRSLKSCVDK